MKGTMREREENGREKKTTWDMEITGGDQTWTCQIVV
jgi:hypothetical protein